MEEITTWESAAQDPAPVEPTPIVEAPEPVETQPAATLEKPEAAPLEAEPSPARESEIVTPEPAKEEPKAEEYVAEVNDPAEIAALPTPAAKKWAKRQFKDAEPLRNFLAYDHPIADFASDLQKRSTTRYQALVDDLATNHPDYLSNKLFGVPFEQAKAQLKSNVPTPTPKPQIDQPTGIPPELEGLAPEVIEQFTQREQALAQERAAKEAIAQKVADLEKQLEAVTGKITNQETQAQKAEISAKQNEIYDQVWSVVEEGIRNSGLEILPTDPPRIANLKTAAAKILRQEAEPAFDKVDENTKIVKYVFEATNRREYDNAMREIDNLKVRARAAFESVKNSPDVKEILQQIQAEAQSKPSRPANPVPPAPGSSVGVAPKQPGTWDEAVSMAQAAS